MGAKIRGKYLLVLLFALFIFVTGTKTFAQTVPQKIVRVAISNNNFQTFSHKELSIFALSDFYVYDKETCKQLAKLTPDDILKIKMSANGVELTVKNKIITKQKTPIIVDCPKGLIGVENVKRNGKQAYYHGYFETIPKNDTQFLLVNVIELESYLKGVVPNEMPVRFGLEALKAQAIAARNYVLTPRTRGSKDFDVDDSVASQVYFGANSEDKLSSQAVNETQGLVALYNWDLILAQYSSTAGGYTENYENAFSDPKTGEFPSKPKPYLVGRPDIYNVAPLNREEEAKLFYMSYPDSYDMKSPYYRWKKEWDITAKASKTKSTTANAWTKPEENKEVNEVNELEEVLKKTLPVQSKTGFIKPKFKEGDELGELKEIKVTKRGVSGKVMELQIITDKGIYTVSKELVIRRLFQKNGVSLPSANVVFENLYDTNKKLNKVTAYGGGFGHGVGMSQYGAGFMATSLHKTFDKILKRYYTGITISTMPIILSADDSQSEVSQTFFAPKKKAVLVVDDKFQISKFNANINGCPVTFELEKNLIPSHRISRIDISNYIKTGENTATFYFPKDVDCRKAIRLYIELVEKDDNNYNF